MDKKFILIIGFLLWCLSPLIKVHGQALPQKKYIFELDITKSMCGYGGAPDILEQVVEQLKSAINNLEDTSSVIYIATFQDKILERWQEQATKEGKRKLIKKLDNIKCKDLPITNTNLLIAYDDMEKQLEPDKMNIAFLLTDGDHNVPDKSKLISNISNWGTVSGKYNKGAYSFFVELTKNAIDPQIRQAVNDPANKNIQIINGIEFYILQIQHSKQIVNINDQMKIQMVLIKDNWNHEYDHLPLSISLADTNFKLSMQSVKIGDLPIEIEIIPNDDLTKLKRILLPESDLKINIKFDEAKYPQIKLLTNEIHVQVNNKKEKVLYLKVK